MKEETMSFEAVVESYIIDRTLIFIPDESFIQNLETREYKKLKHTESQCLLLLLAKQGVVVPQLDLMKFAWGEKHRDVSFNIFYQRILALRKAFVQLGMTKNIIITLPRKGLIIDNGITIETHDETSSKLNNDAFEINDEVCKNKNHMINCLPSHPAINFFTTRLNRYTIIAIILSTVIISLFTLYSGNDRDYFSDYYLASKNNNPCQIFFNTDTDNHSRHWLFINQNLELCRPKKTIYITTYNNTKNLSLLICSAPIYRTKNNRCSSFYYPDYQTK
ncbi:transcriptional regulator [Serratia proteamaculans]|uniref:winged helix-turn-helix domain-containing protein n=1 Tax=Serratia proteamaculans TaxID=28151 RepID=UPI0015777342|nr:winged helix-turn-helix domain-containing protein [Serratia proteamaculans]NTX81031.1 transcriptional regulator [Serratia proteamaculans]NTZ30233.1 transcriptional regulator [Serratia proteamaculans]